MVLRLGTGCLALAGLAGLWQLLANQAPGTPLYIGMLASPIERLVHDALTFGGLLWLAGLAVGERRLPMRVLLWLGLGAVVLFGSAIYGAAHGMPGVQLQDLRADAIWVFSGKLLGRLLLVLGLGECVWGVIGRRASHLRP
jgi:hypothetical protein